jgi:WD40 repeat protein
VSGWSWITREGSFSSPNSKDSKRTLAKSCSQVLSAPIPKVYFTDGSRSPGAVYSYDPVTHTETGVYTRPSGNLYSFLFAPWDTSQLYFVNANEYKIYRKSLGGGPEEVLHTHTTYVRDIADKDGILYFSEASGGASDGKIWRVGAGGTPTLFYQVRLSEVGAWWGNFTFDKTRILYLSNGALRGASIYRVDVPASTVAKLFTDPESISGMAFGDDGALYYGNWGASITSAICRLDITTMTKTAVCTSPTHLWLSDVGFMPGVTIPPSGVSTWVMP